MSLPTSYTKKNKRLALLLFIGVLAMFGFCYLMIPLFNMLCKEAGIDGKGVITAAPMPAGMRVDSTRTIKVMFTSTLHSTLGFKFRPLHSSIDIHPGEVKQIYFYAENNTGIGKTVQAVPSITPADAARFFKKIQCFCFTQQYFSKGEKAEMPVNFYIDPAVPQNIKEMTLSYTLFDATGFEKKGSHFTQGRIDL